MVDLLYSLIIIEMLNVFCQCAHMPDIVELFSHERSTASHYAIHKITCDLISAAKCLNYSYRLTAVRHQSTVVMGKCTSL